MNKRIAFVILAIAVMAAFSTTVKADIIQLPLNNPSFQANVVGDGLTTTKISGWNKQYGAGLVTANPAAADFSGAGGSGALPAPADGSQALWNSSTTDVTSEIGNSALQSLDSGKWYVWTYAVGNANTKTGGMWFDGFATQISDNTKGGSLISQELHPVSQGGVTWWNTGNGAGKLADDPAPGTFLNYGEVFSADDYINGDDVNDGDQLFFGFVICSQTYIDNATLYECDSYAEAKAAETAGGCYVNDHTGQYELGGALDTPEPSTLVLLASGLIGLLAYAWRKRK